MPLPDDDWRPLYPFDQHVLRIDGQRYHYVDQGSGEPLLMVHGNPTWSFYWRNLIRHFSDRYRVIAVDHIGCGLSDKPQQYPYCLERHVQNLQHLIGALDLRHITLLAHDWGGAIGMGAAVAEPERFARFVLFNTAAFRAERMPLRIRICRIPLLGALAVRGFNAFARGALRMAVCHRDRMTPPVRAGLLAPYDNWTHRVALHRFVLDIPTGPRHPSYATLRRIETGLAALREHPLMLVWGMRDWCFTPWFLDRFIGLFPDAEVHRLPDAGHYVVEDAHEQIGPLVDQFLARHALAGEQQR